MTEKRYGGFTEVARELTAARGLLVTRQGVYAWWRRRDRNDFPDRHLVPNKNGKGTRQKFSLDEVSSWYIAYMAAPRQGRKRLRTANPGKEGSENVSTSGDG